MTTKTSKVKKTAAKEKTATPTLSKGELARHLASKMSCTLQQAELFLNCYIESVTEGLASGQRVALPSFGTLEVRLRTARSGRNPSTGEVIAIPASKTVGFKPGTALKKAIN